MNSVSHRPGRLLFFLEWIQLGILFPTFFPAAYLLAHDRSDELILPLFLSGTSILLPALAAKLAIRRIKGFLLYALLLIVLVVLTGCAGLKIGDLQGWPDYVSGGFAVSLAAGTFLVMITCVMVRLRENSRAKAVREQDYTWKDRDYAFEKASPPLLAWFVIFYLAAKIADCPQGCNIAAVCFVLYAGNICLDRYLREQEKYIRLLSYVKQLPVKRIRLIGIGTALTFLLLAGIAAALPGAVTSAYRTYADIRKWQLEGNVLRPEEWNIEPFSNPKQLESFSDLIPDQETHELPEYVKGMGYVLCFIIFAGLAVLLLRMFWKFCGEFRDTEEENGDVSDTFLPDRREKLRPAAHQRGSDSERERIRRRYRREIKKHHPGKPLPSLTPHEIEAEAGLAGTPEGEELHGIYEEARYDRY